MSELKEKVRAYMKAHRMVTAGDTVLVGFSGGADSLCLLVLLQELGLEEDFSVRALHVHHGIRGQEADADAAFCRAFCRERRLPCDTVRVDVPALAAKEGLSEEEAGRRLRREVIGRYLAGGSCTKAALAHHENDLAETMLYHMSRGTGPAGLCALKPVRGPYIRPLLCVSRREIEAFLAERGLTYVTDSTNAADDHTRNRLRHHVVPYLTEAVNPEALRHFRELSETTEVLLDYIRRDAGALLETAARQTEEGVFVTDAFFEAHPALTAEGLRMTYARLSGSLKDLGRSHVKALEALARGREGRRIDLPSGITAERQRGGLMFRRAGEAAKAPARTDGARLPAEGIVLEEGVPVVCGEWRILAKFQDFVPLSIPDYAYTKWLDYDRMKGTLRLRNRRPGDRLTVTDDGVRKSLSDYLINEKVPCAVRDQLILLCDDREVLWVVGHRIGAGVKVTSGTRRVLKITAERLT